MTLSALNDVVQILFFFFPKRRHSETAPTFFFPSYTASFYLSQNHSSETLISHFSITLNPHSSLPLSNPHTLKSQSLPRTVAAQPLSLAPSHFALRSSASSSLSRRTSQLSLSPASPSQCSLDRSSLVAVAAQPRYFIYGITNTKDSKLQ